jgi:hypothetical protein
VSIPADRRRRRGLRRIHVRDITLSTPIPVLLVATTAATVVTTAPAAAPAAASPATVATKKVLGIDDYTRWRSIEGAQISGDGRWVAYTLRFMNTRPVKSKPSQRIVNLASGNETEVEGASSPVFSPVLRSVANALDCVPARRPARAGAGDSAAAPGGQRAGTAQPPRMELRKLATGATQSWQNMNSATFSPTSSHCCCAVARVAVVRAAVVHRWLW